MTPRWLSLATRYRRLCGALGLALVIIAGRWAVIGHYGSDLPLMDQWAAETNAFLIPWGKGDLNPLNLFKPTNEHRVFFTHLVNGGLALVSGRWDARLQTVTNAVLYASLLAALWATLARGLPRAPAAGLLGLFAMAGGLPLVFENMLWGFQSQFFLLAGFSLFSIHLLLTAVPGTRQWWAGCAAGACALVSMGSGLIAPGIVMAVVLARAVRTGRDLLRREWPTLAAALALLTLGWLARTPAAADAFAQHADPARVARYFFAGLAWPATGQPWLASFFFSPVLFLGGAWWRRPEWRDATSTFLLAGSIWMLLQTAAIAYGRSGAPLWPPPNRYGDIYLYGVLFNGAALAWFVGRAPQGLRLAAHAAAVVFAVVFVVVATRATTAAFTHSLPQWRTDSRRYEASVARYLRDGNEYALTPGSFPYTRRFEFLNILRERGVRARLPDSVIVSPSGPPPTATSRAGGLTFVTSVATTACSAWVACLVAGLGLIALWLRPTRNFEV